MIEDAVLELIQRGHEVAAAVLAGGREKLPDGGLDRVGGAPVLSGDEVSILLREAITRTGCDAVMDLSDEPVLDNERRLQLASVALALGVPYEGADFRLSPPPRPLIATKPTAAVIGTGKRTGKTAINAFAARVLAAAGHRPVVVAMGRGGPPTPQVLRGDELSLGAADLVALADEGRHAASDHIEDALLARVPTVGCRRCGGGLAGAVGISNVAEGVRIADGMDGDILLLEGSGAAIPPVHADATCLVVPASIPLHFLRGYLGPYRMLLAGGAVVTMAEYPFADPFQVSDVVSCLEAWLGGSRGGRRAEAPVVRTVFRPSPARDVEGAKVFVATTAPVAAGDAIRRHLERHHGCEVTRISHNLSDRKALREDLEDLDGADVLLCEIKAAGVDVAARAALRAGIEVVFMDNQPVGVDGDDPEALVREIAAEAFAAFAERERA